MVGVPQRAHGGPVGLPDGLLLRGQVIIHHHPPLFSRYSTLARWANSAPLKLGSSSTLNIAPESLPPLLEAGITSMPLRREPGGMPAIPSQVPEQFRDLPLLLEPAHMFNDGPALA